MLSSAEGNAIDQNSSKVVEFSSSNETKEESTEDPGKERTPSPPLKANGLRIKVGNRRNSGPSPPPPPTEADVLVNFDPKPLHHDLLSDPAPASCDRSELEMDSSLGKQLSSSTEDRAEQVLSVTQESSASKPISNSPGHGEPMTSPSQPISFQPPLPTSAPSPPPPPPPPPPLPPPKQAPELLTGSSPTLSIPRPAVPRSDQTPSSSYQAWKKARSQARPSSEASTLPRSSPLESTEPSSGSTLPQSRTVDRAKSIHHEVGERSKASTASSASLARSSTATSLTKERTSQPIATPTVRSPLDIQSSTPQLPTRYKIPKTKRTESNSSSSRGEEVGGSRSRSVSASRVESSSVVKQGREGRRKPEKTQR